MITRYGINYGTKITQTDVNFAISVGVRVPVQGKRKNAIGNRWARLKILVSRPRVFRGASRMRTPVSSFQTNTQ